MRSSQLDRMRQQNPPSLPLSQSALRIRVKPGDNWLIPGRKGSGKTYFSKRLYLTLLKLFPTHRLSILDIKLRDFNDWPGLSPTDGHLPKAMDGNQQIQIWQPEVIEPDVVEEWLYKIRHDPPHIVGIDELLALCYGKRDSSDEYGRIQKLGRALPILTVSNTQELVDIPRNVIGQSDHVARFRLKHPYEQRMINNIIGLEKDIEEPVDKYGFWYANTEVGGEPIYYKNAQTFLGTKEIK